MTKYTQDYRVEFSLLEPLLWLKTKIYMFIYILFCWKKQNWVALHKVKKIFTVFPP